jgi:hypothetical protein
MTRSSAKIGKLLRLRTIQHRLSVLEFAVTRSKLDSLGQTREKLVLLKKALAVKSGTLAATTLKSQGEMAGRIDLATDNLQFPFRAAQQRYDDAETAMNIASLRENKAAELFTGTLALEKSEASVRADANIPFRRMRSPMRCSK